MTFSLFPIFFSFFLSSLLFFLFFFFSSLSLDWSDGCSMLGTTQSRAFSMLHCALSLLDNSSGIRLRFLTPTASNNVAQTDSLSSPILVPYRLLLCIVPHLPQISFCTPPQSPHTYGGRGREKERTAIKSTYPCLSMSTLIWRGRL